MCPLNFANFPSLDWKNVRLLRLRSRLLGDQHDVKITNAELERFLTWSFEMDEALLEDPHSLCKANGCLIDILLEALLYEPTNNYMVSYNSCVSGEILHAVKSPSDAQDCFKRAVDKYCKKVDLSAQEGKTALIVVEMCNAHFVLLKFDTKSRVCKIIDPALTHSEFPRDYSTFCLYMAAWLESKGSYTRNTVKKAKTWVYAVENLDSHQCDSVSCGYIVVLLILREFGRIDLDDLFEGGVTTVAVREKLWNALLEEHEISMYKKH